MIRIISGVYGDGMKRASDGPFCLSEKEEARLVARGVAEYVGGEPAPVPTELPELPEGVIPISEYSVNSSLAELREVAKLCGITFKVGMSKSDMVAALDAHIAANTVDEAEPVSEGDAEEPMGDEPAPVFNAAEAVQ